jgi:hypothetical protein
MNGMRKVLCFLMAMILAAFALPSIAAQSQNKTYTLTMTVLTQGVGDAPSKVKAVLTNTSPKQSSSTFSSADVFVDLGWTIVTDDPTNFPITVVQSGTSATPSLDTTTQGHIKLSGLHPVKPQETVTITFYVTVSSCGDATWDAAVWSGSQVGTGNFFIRPVPDTSVPLSPVACTDLACASEPESFTVGNLDGFRWSSNKDGSTTGAACGPVKSYVSNLNSNNVIHFRWDNAAQGDTFGSAVFYYRIDYVSPPSPARVGWLNQDGSPAIGPGADPSLVAFIDAPACASQVSSATDIPTILPQPYGVLQTAINSTSSTTIKVDTTGGIPTPLSLPFSIVIGPPGAVESMDVTAMASSGWTVTRGTRGTTAVKHPKGAFAMSNLLPPLSALTPCYDAGGNTLLSCPAKYNSPYQAQMCLPVSPANTSPAIWYVDIGDGWVGLP